MSELIANLWTLLGGRRDVMVVLGLVLATAVTLHALMHKRDVSSAIGWIGLAWLAPMMGSLAYLVFGINRVRHRARALRPKPHGHGGPPQAGPLGIERHLGPMARGIGAITGRPPTPGNRVRMFQNGDEAFPPMLAAIAAARTSIGLSTYIFRDDEWGGRFVEALAAAARRGVAVRVLIDGFGGGWLLSRAYRRLRREGVPATRFLHSLLPWRMPFINLRSHKKILVVDGIVGFTGGMNIADENVMATRPRHPVQDTHFRLDGPVVAQLTEAFAQDWAYATREQLTGAAWFPLFEAAGDADERLAPAGHATGRVIDSGPDEDMEKIEFAILEALATARDSVSVMTPYFLPDERLMSALSLAAMRGVAVDLVIPERSNHFYVDGATRANVAPILRDGVRIWRCPPPFRHSKVMVVDAEWCLIGSCNWDIRSFRLNFELCVELYDTGLAAELEALMRRSRGRPLTLAGLQARSLPLRLGDAGLRLLSPYL
ncbi:MAG: phospholipase D-like domain-containing protein [Janthinobacterium lividum]